MAVRVTSGPYKVTREKKRKTHSNTFKTNCANIAGRTELLSERLRVERLSANRGLLVSSCILSSLGGAIGLSRSGRRRSRFACIARFCSQRNEKIRNHFQNRLKMCETFSRGIF